MTISRSICIPMRIREHASRSARHPLPFPRRVEDALRHDGRGTLQPLRPVLCEGRAVPTLQRFDDLIDLRVGLRERAAGVHNEIGARALFGIAASAAPASARASPAVMPGRCMTRARCASAGALTDDHDIDARSPPVSSNSGISSTAIDAPAAASRAETRARPRTPEDARWPRAA